MGSAFHVLQKFISGPVLLGDIGSGCLHSLLIFAQYLNVCLVVITLHYSRLEGRARGGRRFEKAVAGCHAKRSAAL